ncbi:MAG: endo-1,4-beta-xylanase [Clostridia bacterium]|nr:endo-1,4-beta-xylanase [Clostridia bacterium]
MKKLMSLVLAVLMCLSCSAIAEEERGALEYQPLKELTVPLGFTMGAPLSYNQMADGQYLKLLRHHFDTITTTNEMKAYSLLDQRASQRSSDGMPVMNYTKADKMVSWAQKAGLKVRGHVLVWDAYMTQWFFHEGYDVSKPIADQETMRQRVQSYIEDVICHFEEKFPGVVYCWDVVNEAVGDNAGEYVPSDARHVRTKRNGAANPFYEYVGEDYVELSFLYARDTVDRLGADIKLFYNDYSSFYENKRNAIKTLVESINSYAVDENGNPRKLIDGVGMQGYIGGYGTQSGCFSNNDLALIKKSIQEYAALGVQVQLTEMSVRNYRVEEDAQHAEYYGRLFKVFASVNSGDARPLTSVAIWGVKDCNDLPTNHYTYKLNGPYCGLFDLKLNVKNAFKTVYAQLGGE